MGSTPTPPLPPDVSGQMQAPPGYVDSAMQAGYQPAMGRPGPGGPAQIAEGLLQEIVERLAKVAAIYQEEQPQVLPIIKRMAEMGSQLVEIVNQSKQKGRQVEAGPEPGRPPQAALRPPEGPGAMAA